MYTPNRSDQLRLSKLVIAVMTLIFVWSLSFYEYSQWKLNQAIVGHDGIIHALDQTKRQFLTPNSSSPYPSQDSSPSSTQGPSAIGSYGGSNFEVSPEQHAQIEHNNEVMNQAVENLNRAVGDAVRQTGPQTSGNYFQPEVHLR
jgi:hypothetical protein